MGEHRPEHWPGLRELPPRPDPNTGEPFPPHAPVYQGNDTAPEDNPLRERRLSHKPTPPDGMGPVIAWNRSNIKGKIHLYIISLAILIVGMSVITMAEGDGIDWMRYWPLWLFFAIVAYLMSSPLKFETTSVGADWLQIRIMHPFRRTKQDHIKLYELIEIDGSSSPTAQFLRINDGNLASERPLHEWQGDRRIWDLMYNGILHSVANGAHINKHAVQLLRINDTPALEIARQRGRSGMRRHSTGDSGKHRPKASWLTMNSFFTRIGASWG